MPIGEIKFNREKVSKDELADLHIELQEILVNLTGMKDVFVYVNGPEIAYRADPVEIFVRLSGVQDVYKLSDDLSEHLKNWKKRTGFSKKMNLTVIPMGWVVKENI